MRIGVVGSINMDMAVIAPRIPSKGETLIGEKVCYTPGGKGANQAVAMARLGAEVLMFGCVGEDNFKDELLSNLKSNHVNTTYIQKQPDASSGMAFITIAEQDNTIVVVPGANHFVTKKYIDSIMDPLLTCSMVVLQHEIPIKTVEYVISICHEHGIKTILNPAPACFVSKEVIHKVTYLTPNEHEAALIFPEEENMSDLLRKYPEKLIITQGDKGVAISLKTGEVLNIPPRKTKVIDTTGAGDTLNGAFAVRIANQDSIDDALRYANIAASLSVEKFGAQGGMPTFDQVKKEVESC